MNNEFITLISAQLVSTVTIVISIIVLFLHLSKKIDNISKELSELKIENQKEHSELKEAILQVHHKHEILKTEQTQLKEQVAEIKTEHKSYIKELTNKVFESLPKSAL